MKKQSNGEKREAQLRYRFRQLKRNGILPKDMTMKQFRGSEFNAFITKKITFKNKAGKEVIRTIKKMIPLKAVLEVDNKYGTSKYKKPQNNKLSRRQRKSERRHVRHFTIAYRALQAQKRAERLKERKRRLQAA